MEANEILKKLREDKGLTMKEVSEATKMSTPLISDYETGKKTMGMKVAIRFADYYNVSLDYLLGRTPVKQMATEENDPFAGIDISAVEKRIIEKYTALDKDMRAICIEAFRQLSGVIITENGEVKYESSQKIQPKTYPIPTAARRGINGKYFSGNTEYMTEDEINAILNAEDGDEDL